MGEGRGRVTPTAAPGELFARAPSCACLEAERTTPSDPQPIRAEPVNDASVVVAARTQSPSVSGSVRLEQDPSPSARLCFWEWLGGDLPTTDWEHGVNPGAGGSAFITVRTIDLLARARPDRAFALIDFSGDARRPDHLPTNVEFIAEVDWVASSTDVLVVPTGASRAQSSLPAAASAAGLIAWSHHPFDPALMRRRDHRRPYAVVSPGAFAAASNRLSGRSISHIPHPVAAPARMRATVPHPDGPFELAFMSSGLAVKGLPDVAVLWLRLRALLPGARLHVIGSDPPPTVSRSDAAASGWRHRKDAAARAFREDIDAGRVVLHGRMGVERFALLASCHAGIVNPRGISESWCITAFEMMSVGLPIVSSGEFGMFEPMRSHPEQTHRSISGQSKALVRLAQDCQHWQDTSCTSIESVESCLGFETEIARRWLLLADGAASDRTPEPLPDLWALPTPWRRIVRAGIVLVLYRLVLRSRWRRFMRQLNAG